jgi:hypothetical protein
MLAFETEMGRTIAAVPFTSLGECAQAHRKREPAHFDVAIGKLTK